MPTHTADDVAYVGPGRTVPLPMPGLGLAQAVGVSVPDSPMACLLGVGQRRYGK